MATTSLSARRGVSDVSTASQALTSYQLAAIRLATTIEVIEYLVDDPTYPADRSHQAHEQRRLAYQKYLAEFREASKTLREASE